MWCGKMIATALILISSSAVSHDNGQTFAPFTDLSNNAGISTNKQMIVSGNNVYVVWQDDSNGPDSDIFFRVSHDNGQTFAPFTDLSNNAGFSAGQQMIVSGNNVYVVWQDDSNGPDSDIFFRVSDDNGQTFAPFTDLSNNGDGSGSQQMIVSGNNVYVVWQDDSNGPLDIFFRVSDDNGQTFAPFKNLSNNAGFSFTQQMIVSGRTSMWCGKDDSNGPDSDIFFTVSDDNGQTFAPPTDLSNNAGISTNKQMAVSGNNVYVVWEDDSNGALDIFFTVSDDNGQTFAFKNLSNNAGDSDSQEMIVSGNNVYVVWEDNSGNAGNSDIFFRVSDDNGQTFAPFKNLSNNAGASFNSHMIVQ